MIEHFDYTHSRVQSNGAVKKRRMEDASMEVQTPTGIPSSSTCTKNEQLTEQLELVFGRS